MWNQELIEKYSIAGPRYTSYPTALQFTESFQEKNFKQALASADSSEPIGLYVHIPFCENICFYCACNKVITKHNKRAERYLQALFKEAQKLAPLVANRKVTHMHWGGGSPTFLTNAQIIELFSHLSDIFHFELDAGEFAIEIDPRSIDEDTVPVLKKLGFNRLSVGVQDFKPQVQQAVNRVHSTDKIRSLVERAREVGFESLSFDFIYGLPFQTEESFTQSMKTAIEMMPDRVSIFNYAHLPSRFKSQRRINRYDLPKAEMKLGMLESAIETLKEAGYLYIGMDHFALPHDSLVKQQQKGNLHRNFQGYSSYQNCDTLGLGVSAISSVQNTYSQNVRELENYYQAIENDSTALWRGYALDFDDLIRAEVIEQLICHFELDFDRIEQRFDVSFQQYFANELDTLLAYEADGLVNVSDKSIRVTDVGRLLIRNICMVFDHYMQELSQVQKYSKSI